MFKIKFHVDGETMDYPVDAELGISDSVIDYLPTIVGVEEELATVFRKKGDKLLNTRKYAGILLTDGSYLVLSIEQHDYNDGLFISIVWVIDNFDPDKLKSEACPTINAEEVINYA